MSDEEEKKTPAPEKPKRKPPTEDQKVRKNAAARADRKVGADKGLQAIIVELAVSNEGLGRIETTLKSFKDISAASIERIDKADTRMILNGVDIIMGLHQIIDRMDVLVANSEWIKGKSSQIAEYTDEMVDSLNWLSKFFSTSKLQAAEDRKEFLALIKELEDRGTKNDRVTHPAPAAPPASNGPGLADAAVGASLIETVVKGATKALVGAGGLVAGLVTGVLSSIKDIFAELGKGIFSLIKRVVGEERVAKIVAGVEDFFIMIKSGLGRFLKPLEPIIEFMKGGLKVAGENSKKFLGAFEGITEWIATIAKPFYKIGKFLGKLAVPLTVIISTYDTIMAAFKSWERGDSFGDILKNSVSGMINSLISAPLDLVKGAAAWILDKVGATSIAEGLRGWDFSGWISEIIDRVVTFGRNIFQKIFAQAFSIVDNIKNGFSKGIFVGVAKSLQTLVHFMVTKPMQQVIDMIADMLEKVPIFGKSASAWIKANVNIAKFTGQGLIDLAPEEFKSEHGDLSMTDAVIKRHDDRIAEEDAKKRIEAAPEKKNIGAEMTAIKNQTNDLDATPDATAVQGGGDGGQVNSITNNASSVTYNAGGLIDRTEFLMKPLQGAASWQ